METQEHTRNEQAHRAVGRVSPRKPTHCKWAHFLPPLVDGPLGENLSLQKVHKATTKNSLCNLPRIFDSLDRIYPSTPLSVCL